MELTNVGVIKNLLRKHEAEPKKYLGQHFILSKNALGKIISAGEIKKTDVIVEIGPGIGTLTKKLLKTGARIVAVEKDGLMLKILNETVGNPKNFRLIREDARKIDWDTFIPKNKKYKIIANLPYNIATFLIRSWLAFENPPQKIVVMVQKELANRIVAKPPDANLLGLAVQYYAHPKIIGRVPKQAFWPQPKVDSSIIIITPHNLSKGDERKFFSILKAGFQQKRKQISGNLKRGLKNPESDILEALCKAEIDPKARAQEISLDKWLILAQSL